MTHKDFELLAAAILASKPGVNESACAFGQFYSTLDKIADALADAYPSFDYDRFLAASGS